MTDRGRDRACILGTAAAAFLVYAVTACPTVPPGDSGELIAAAWSGGVAHPPGYPLYIVFGWLWSHVLWPFGNVAWRLNLFSAAAMAGAVGFTVAGARVAGAGRWPAVTAAATFALAAEVWRAAVAAEVFAGHACVTAAVLWLFLRWGRAPAPAAADATEADAAPAPVRWPWVGALVLGIGGAVHQTALLLVPAIGFWAYVHRDRFGDQLKNLAAVCVLITGAAAFLPYGFLMPLSTRDHALVWGDLTTLGDDTGYSTGTARPESAQGAALPERVTDADYSGLGEGLWHHMLRKAYGPMLGSRSDSSGATGGGLGRLPHVAAWLWHYVISGAGGLWLLGLGFAGFGAWRRWSARDDTRAAAGTVAPVFVVALLLAGTGSALGWVTAAAGLAVLLALWGRATATADARLAWFLVLAWFASGPLFIAYGVNFDASDALRRAVVSRFFVMPAVPLTLLGALGLQALAAARGDAAVKGAGMACAVLAGGVALLGGAPLWGVDAVERYGRNLLASIPEDPARPALLFVQGDVPNNAVDYLQYCEGARPDVAMLNQQKLTYPWYVRREERRFAGDAHAVDVPGERYDGRVVTNLRLINANIARRRVYFFGIATGDNTYQSAYWRIPHGLVSRMVPHGTPLDPADIARANLEILDAVDWTAVRESPGDAYFLDEVREAHANAWYELALFLHTGPNGTGTPVDHPRAAKIYERALALFPDHPNTVLGYGLLLGQNLNRLEEAKPYLIRYLQMRPKDPRAPQIAQLAGLEVVPRPK